MGSTRISSLFHPLGNRVSRSIALCRSLLNKLADILLRWWTCKQWLRKQLRYLTVGHEGMHTDLLESWSCRRVSSQDSRNEVSCFIGDWHVLWERILVSLDSAVCGFDIGGLKRRFPYDEGINDDSQGPDINLVRVSCSSLQNFGSDVVGRSANCSILFSVEIKLGC